MYYFVKMSIGWIGCEFAFLSGKTVEKIMQHAREGEIVAISDDIEGFADEMGIEIDDIQMV